MAVAAGTALIAGIMTIAMGVIGNYPFALAAGLGINAIVAFTPDGEGPRRAGAMGVIVLEGVVITVLVVVGLREAIMNAVPLSLKRSIGVGIGLFILFIGFANGGLIVSNCAPARRPRSATAARHAGVPDVAGAVRVPASAWRSRSSCSPSRSGPR